MQRPPIAFTGSPLDRADAVRSDPARLADLLATGRMLVLDGIDPRVEHEALVWAPVDRGVELVFLGLDAGGIGHFAPVAQAGSAAPASFNLWAALSGMAGEEIAIYGTARALVNWHARHRFCAQCGAPTAIAKGGWQRDCTVCPAQHFPRTDPVVIMLVASGEKCLLGRQKQFPPGMYSCLAGFVEAAETIEDAVRREILEESGIRCTDVQYYMTQPWPYPSSLMIGCSARALNEDVVVDHSELEDARWFTREEARLMLSRTHPDGLAGPHPFAIAHHLLGRWVHDKTGG